MRVVKEVKTMLEGMKKDNSEQDSVGKKDDDDDNTITCPTVCEDSPGICSYLLTFCSLLIIMATLPFSLLYTVKVVQVFLPTLHSIVEISSPWQEYERAVIFRLGRLLTGGARGPGVFFIIPCVDIYEKVDMRTCTYEIPPQEVRDHSKLSLSY